MKKSRKVFTGYVSDIKNMRFNSTLSDYRYMLYGIYKHPKEYAKQKVKITIEQIS